MKKNICNNCNYYNNLYNLLISNEEYIINYIQLFKIKKVKNKIQLLINEKWDLILEHINIFDNIIIELKKNKNLKKSLIGNLIKEYDKIKKNIRNKNNFYENILKFIDRENFYNEIKQILFILSNNKRCNLLVYDRERHSKISKKYIEKLLEKFKKDLNLLKSYLIRDIIKLNWGLDCRELQKMYYLLHLINEKYKNPLIIFNVKYSYKKKYKNIKKRDIEYNKDLIKTLLTESVLKYNKGDTNLISIDNISSLILHLKKTLSIWEIIDLIFDEIFEINLKNIQDSIIYKHNNIEYQRNNNRYAFKLFILVKHNLINNINIFQGF